MQNLITTFPLGAVVITPPALEGLDFSDIFTYLQRHATQDWGEADEVTQTINNRSLAGGVRLMSSYATESGASVFIITEADHLATTILLT